MKPGGEIPGCSMSSVLRGGVGERGNAIIMVLLLLTFLGGLGFAFRQMMGLKGRIVASHVERAQAGECARAGLEVALSLLRSDDPAIDTLGDSWASSSFLAGTLEGRCRYWLRPGGGVSAAGIRDLEGRLPVNRLPPAFLSRIPGLSAEAARKVEEARKAASIPTVSSFLELAALDREAVAKELGAGAGAFFSVFDVSTVNVNTASAGVLAVVLGDMVLAREIVKVRRGKDGRDGTEDDRPWRSLEKLGKLLGKAGVRVDWLSVQSSLFEVVSVGEARNGTFYARYGLQALVRRTEAGDVTVVSSREL